jgi:hypothetical protein
MGPGSLDTARMWMRAIEDSMSEPECYCVEGAGA